LDQLKPDFEDRFSDLQDLMDEALARATDKFILNFNRMEASGAHRELADGLFACADGQIGREKLKGLFRSWLELIKCQSDVEKLMVAPARADFSELRKCFSFGCLGLVRFVCGVGHCPGCGLRQILVEAECTYLTYSTPNPEPSKVVSLATRRKSKASGSDKRESDMSLF
jgi:hypothetical protein